MFILEEWGEGGPKYCTHYLLSIFALYAKTKVLENLTILTSNKSKLSMDANNSDIILVSMLGCLYRRCRIDSVSFT